jgi:IS4 transposase
LILTDGRSLEALLTSTRRTVDCPAFLTVHKHPVRLVAFRSSEEIASRRRQNKKAKRRLNGTNANKASLIREGWSIYVTNLPVDKYPPERIFSLYRQLWAIEIQFHA